MLDTQIVSDIHYMYWVKKKKFFSYFFKYFLQSLGYISLMGTLMSK